MNLLNQFKKTLLENGDYQSNATVKNYVADIRKFIAWFELTFQRPFPPPVLPHGLVELYLKLFEATSPRSAKRYQSSLKKFFAYLQNEGQLTYNPLVQQAQLKANPDPWHLKDFGNFLYNSKASPLTIKNYLQDVKQFLNWAKEVTSNVDADDDTQLSSVLPTTEPQVSNQDNLIAKIDTFMLMEYKNRLIIEAKLSPLSVNRKLSSLRKYIVWSIDNNLIHNKRIEVPNIQIAPDKAPAPQPVLTDQELSVEALQNMQALQSTTQVPETMQQVAEIKKNKFSRFPPLRLLQKIKWAMGAAFDALIILSIIKSFEAIKYNLWKAAGKEIFASLPSIIQSINPGTIPQPEIKLKKTLTVVDQFVTMGEKAHFDRSARRASIGRFRSIPKSVYAPLKISTSSLPLWEKVVHTLKYSRPRWYKIYHNYSFAHYLHFAIVIIFTTYAGFTIYSVLKSPPVQKNVLSEKVTPSRLISFHGRLNDADDAPITQESLIRFAIYNGQEGPGSTRVWEERQRITPEPDGTFTTILGKNSPIAQEIFTDNPSLYLGISIGSDPELKPRQELASIELTKNSQELQGLKPITGNNSDTANVILALDSSGNLTIGGSASPIFQASGGEFKLSGQQLTLTTNDGSNSNVQIVPDGAGIIDLQKPLQNTSNNNNLESALGAVEVDDNFAILASSSAQSALIINQNSEGGLISASTGGSAKFTVDNLGSGTFAGDINILGNNISSTSKTFNIANQNTTNLNIGGAATSVFIGASTGTTSINNNLKVAGTLSLSGFTPGSIAFTNTDGQIGQDNANFFWDNTNKRLGLGTASPTKMLDVQGEIQINLAGPQSTFALCGSHSAGSGATVTDVTIVDCAGTPAADYMELYSVDSVAEIGDIVVPSTNYATTLDNERLAKLTKSTKPYQASIIGIISDKNKAGDFNSVGHNIKSGDNPLPVALSGRVPVKIAHNSAPVKPGDYLTSSSEPGRAMKAEKAGIMVGKALEEWDPPSASSEQAPKSTIMVYVNLSWFDPALSITEDGTLASQEPRENTPIITEKSDSIEKTAKPVQRFLDTLETGVLEVHNISTQSLSIATDDIKIGAQTLREYISAIVNEAIDKRFARLAEALAERAEESKNKISIVSPVADVAITASNSANIDQIPTPTQTIKPPDTAAGQSGNIINITNIYNNVSPSLTGSNSAITESDSAPNATPTPVAQPAPTQPLSPTPTIQPSPNPSPAMLPTPQPTAFPTPTTSPLFGGDSSASDKTIPEELVTNQPLTKSVDLATFSAELSYIPNLKSDFATFNYGLIALGPTSLAETSINDGLRIGSQMTIDENSINTFGSDLNLQSLRQGNFTVMGGLFTIDTEGNMNISGNATFAKDVNIKGTLAAGIISPLAESDLVVKLGRKSKNLTQNNAGQRNSAFIVSDATGSAKFSVNDIGDIISSGSAQFANIKLVRGVQADTSISQTVAQGSAGTAVITASQTERTIVTPFATENSLIYITPVTNTQGTAPYIARQTIEDSNINSKGSFTVQIAQPVTSDIKLNWWIIN